MQIIVTQETNGTELYHLSILFQSLAKAHGFIAPVESSSSASQTSTVGEMSVTLNVDTSNATSAVEALADLIDRTGVKVEDVPPVTVSVDEQPTQALKDLMAGKDVPGNEVIEGCTVIDPPATNTNLDVNGLPWDARIHAGSRERNTDGSWRVRRRPKGVEEADWDATLARVTAELTELMAIPVSPGAVADAAAEEVQVLGDALAAGVYEALANAPEKIPSSIADPNDHGYQIVQEPINNDHASIDDAGTVTVHVAPPVTIAPPVVVPPVTAVAPPITVDKPAIETFAQLMSWLTSRTPKDEAAKPAMVTRVNEILAANGLTTLQQLGQRADLIPQVLVQFREAFGE